MTPIAADSLFGQHVAGEDTHDFVDAPGRLGFATFAHFGKTEAVEFVEDAIASAEAAEVAAADAEYPAGNFVTPKSVGKSFR